MCISYETSGKGHILKNVDLDRNNAYQNCKLKKQPVEHLISSYHSYHNFYHLQVDDTNANATGTAGDNATNAATTTVDADATTTGDNDAAAANNTATDADADDNDATYADAK